MTIELLDSLVATPGIRALIFDKFEFFDIIALTATVEGQFIQKEVRYGAIRLEYKGVVIRQVPN